MTFEANIRFEAISIGLDVEQGSKWVAKTMNTARNIYNEGTQGPHKGKSYKRGRNIHIASAPGDWHANDTGNLRIQSRYVVNGLKGEFGSNVDYAEYLQLGTSRMKARKLYREAVNEATEQCLDGLEDVIEIKIVTDAD